MRDRALAIVKELDGLQCQRYVAPHCYVYVYHGLGERERALLHQEDAYRDGGQPLNYLSPFIRNLFSLDPTHRDREIDRGGDGKGHPRQHCKPCSTIHRSVSLLQNASAAVAPYLRRISSISNSVSADSMARRLCKKIGVQISGSPEATRVVSRNPVAASSLQPVGKVAASTDATPMRRGRRDMGHPVW